MCALGHLSPLLDVVIVTTKEDFAARSSGLPAHDETKTISLSGSYFLADPSAPCAP